MPSFLVTSQESIKGKANEMLTGAVMVRVIRLAARIASQDKPTAVVLGKAPTAMAALEAFRGWLNIITRLSIAALVDEFFAAMRSAAVSA